MSGNWRDSKVVGIIGASIAIAAALVVIVSVAPLGYRFEPGAVVVSASTDGPAVTGYFKVRRAPLGVPTDVSLNVLRQSRRGGACLVTRPADVGVPDTDLPQARCVVDADCHPKGRKDWEGYCDKATCWVRPGPGGANDAASAPFCNRSIDHPDADGAPQEWGVGSHQANRQWLRQKDVAAGGGLTWRVVACQVAGNGEKICALGKETVAP